MLDRNTKFPGDSPLPSLRGPSGPPDIIRFNPGGEKLDYLLLLLWSPMAAALMASSGVFNGLSTTTATELRRELFGFLVDVVLGLL